MLLLLERQLSEAWYIYKSNAVLEIGGALDRKQLSFFS
jgi:hypothetical protein